MTSHHSHVRQIIAVISILMLSCSALLAQVTIKERVSINPNSQFQRSIDCTNCGGPLNFVMEHKGTILIYYIEAQRLGSPIPTSARLLVHRLRADTVVTDSILGRFPPPIFTQNHTACPEARKDSAWAYPTPAVPFSAMTVLVGDTVQFYYITDFDPPNGVPDTLIVDPAYTIPQPPYGWYVTFETYDNCRVKFNDEIALFIGVSDTTIAFAPTSTTVYPRYFGHNNQTDKNDTLDLQIQVQYLSAPVKNYWVRVDSSVLVDSGGHSHGGNRPLGTFLVPRLSPAGYDSVKFFTKQTDSLGNLNFKYVASQFGGIERLRAVRLSDTTSFDTLRVTTKVPNLLVFPDPGSYVLSGRTNSHPNNHYITSQSAISALISAANKFAVADWNPTGQMQLNDMSLQYGGGFDLAGGWDYDIAKIDGRRGHRGHREGKSIDIENFQIEQVDTVSQKTGHDTTFTVPKVTWIKKFKRFMEIDMGNWKFQDEGQMRSDVFKRTRRFPHFDWTGN